MLTIQDCIELSGLTEEEIDAIAQHEHLPEMIAVELGNFLTQTRAGEKRIKSMIVEDLREARLRGDKLLVLKLKLCLGHYVAEHAPGAARRGRVNKTSPL